MHVTDQLRSTVFLSTVLIGLLCESGFAGQRNQNSPPPSLKQLFVPYWAVGDGYHSVAQLHNNLINTSLVVHAAVFAVDGTRVELGDVQLSPLGNAQIDIEYALLQQGQTTIRSGSAIFEYQSRHGRALGAEISVSQPAKTLSYTITGSEKGASPADLAAVYWLPSDRAEAYIALQNTSSFAIEVTARFEANGPSVTFQSVALGPYQSHVIDVPVDLTQARTSRGGRVFGGITLSHTGPDGSLLASGWTEEERTGYSNMMTFNDPLAHSGTTLFTTQVFLGNLGDLIATRFLYVQSRLVLLNTSNAVIQPEGDVIYQSVGQIQRKPLSIGTLRPHQAVEIDLDELNLPQDVIVGALRLNYAGPAGALMGRVFGMANDPTFGFYAALESETPHAINEVYWSSAGDAASLLTVTNFNDKPDKVLIELTYQGGKVSLPSVSLRPFESTTINVSEVKKQGGLPADVDYGGIRISGDSGLSRLLAKEHVISERQRTAVPFYGSGPNPVAYDMDPWLTIRSGETGQTHGLVTWDDSSQTIDYGGTLTSRNTSIATVGTQMSTNPFWFPVTGQNGGIVTLDATSARYQPSGWVGSTTMQVTVITVSLTCDKLNLAIGGTPVSGTNTGTCVATGNPSGGTFTWSVNTNTVTLSSNVGQIVTYTSANPSVSGQPTAISVAYIVNGVTAPASVGNIWVRQPTSLAVLSDTGTTTVTCNVGGSTFNGPHRERLYDTRDQMGQSISDAGISTTTVENFPYTTTCNNFTLNTANPNTPRFTDFFQFCAYENRPGGPTCSLSSSPNQTWIVNGITVGTYNVTYTQSTISIAP